MTDANEGFSLSILELLPRPAREQLTRERLSLISTIATLGAQLKRAHAAVHEAHGLIELHHLAGNS